MQINPAYQLPPAVPKGQAGVLPPQPELLKKTPGGPAQNPLRQNPEPQVIEAEYVDLHPPTTPPLTPKVPPNLFILEQNDSPSLRPGKDTAPGTSSYSLLQGIAGYSKHAEDTIPAGLYLDFFA